MDFCPACGGLLKETHLSGNLYGFSRRDAYKCNDCSLVLARANGGAVHSVTPIAPNAVVIEGYKLGLRLPQV
jgi:hypothetical protein